jgi:hypothetical protein
MKNIFSILLAFAVGVSVSAQTVTVTSKGDRNSSVYIDGQIYTITSDPSGVAGANLPVVVTGLTLGQHTLQVMRVNPNNGTYTPGMTTTFTLRSGYDMNITVSANGSVQLSEKKAMVAGSTGYRTPMTDAQFNTLLSRIRSERNQARRATAIRNAFDNINYFTTDQVYDLVSTITSQAQRLALAKFGYKNVVDGENYDDLNTLITSRARRNELTLFVEDYNLDHPGHVSGSGNMAMSTADFDRLYREAQAQYSASTRMSFLSTKVFGPAYHYFTTEQARRMITLQSTESDRLQLAKEAYDNLANPTSYTDFNSLFTYQSSRNELANYVNNKDVTNPRQPMTATRFNELYLDARQQWSYTEKIGRIEDAFEDVNNYFTSTQATQLIALATNESDRLRLSKLSWSRVTDQANYAQFYNVLQSTASRNDFNAFVNSGAAYSPVTTVAMADAAYNTLYNKISNTWGLGAKMSSLTEVFDNGANYFTVAQAEKLIRLVSAEYNRLALAKSSYDNIVDRENFNQLYDIFDSQASVTELETYVNSYSYNR